MNTQYSANLSSSHSSFRNRFIVRSAACLCLAAGLAPSTAYAAAGSKACIVASDALTLEPRSTLTASVTTQILEMQPDSLILGNVFAEHSAILRDRATIDGRLTYEGSLLLQNQVEVSDTRQAAGVVPMLPNQAFPTTEDELEISWDEVRALPSGTYGHALFRSRSEVTLTSGTYDFASLTVEADAVLILDTSSGPIRINVTENVELGSRVEYQQIGDGQVLIYGLDDIWLGADQQFPGSLVAPKGELEIESRVEVSGCVGAETIIVYPDSEIGKPGGELLTDLYATSKRPEFPNRVISSDMAPFGSANAGDDVLQGDEKVDRIDGGQGNDTLSGGGNHDILRGGAGSDWLAGDDGNDQLTGGEGDDILFGGAGDDTLSGGAGNDQLNDSSGSNLFAGGAGDDILVGGSGADWLKGETGNDVANGNGGDDTYIYQLGDGNDLFDGGSGVDTIGISHITDPTQWSIALSNQAPQSLSSFLQARNEEQSFSAIVTSPLGETLTLVDVEKILLNVPVLQSGSSVPLVVPDLYPPSDTHTFVLSGLPLGVSAVGGASVPQADADGGFFQLIDTTALLEGRVTLDIEPGFFGALELELTAHFGEPEDLQTEVTPLSLFVAPTNDSALFAQMGDFGFEVNEDQLRQGRIPVDIVINPLLEDNLRIAVSDLPPGATLVRFDGTPLVMETGSTEISRQDLEGLGLLVGDTTSGFSFQVTLEGEVDGRGVRATQNLFVPVANAYIADNGDTVARFAGKRADYEIVRAGNALLIHHRQNADQVTRLSMVGVDHLRFVDAFVSSRDYTSALDISGLLANVTDPRAFIAVSGLPEGTVLNNAIILADGVFGIPVSDLTDGTLHLDHPKTLVKIDKSVSIQVYSATDDQMEILNSSGRISGYVNAKAFTAGGFDAHATFGADGVRLGARAYAEAGAVATAGGSIEVDGVGRVYTEFQVEVYVKAELEAHLSQSNEAFVAGGYAGVRAYAAVSQNSGAELSAVPGTNVGGKGTAGAYSEAFVKGNQGFYYGGDQYGAEGKVDASVGKYVGAKGYAEGEIAGIGGNASSSVKAGLTASFSANGEATYDKGVITLGVGGELAVLLGVGIDVNFVVDTNEVADTTKLVGSGVVSLTEAIEGNLITLGEAINGKLIKVGEAIDQGFIDVRDAIAQEFLTGAQAVTAGILTETEALGEGLIDSVEEVVTCQGNVFTCLSKLF